MHVAKKNIIYEISLTLRWVEKNKGMAKKEDGKWVLDLLDEEDVPMPQEIEEISLTLRLCLFYGRGKK